MKASQLESMKLLQELIEKERQAAETLIDDKKSYMPKLEEELFTWEEKYKRCQSADKLKKNQHLLMSEYSWAFVISWEKIMDNTQKDKRTLVKSKEKHMEKLSEAEESYERNNKDFEEIKTSISELNKTIKASSVKHDNLASQVKDTGSSFRTKESEKKKFNIILEKKTKDKNQLSEKLEEEKKNSQNNYDHERIQKEQKIAEIKEKIREINNSEKAKINDNRMFTDAIEHTQKVVDDKNFEIQNINNLIRNNEADIDRLKNSSRDQLLSFGSFMVELVNEVKRTYEAKRFKQMPIGPIGMFIEPKNKQWALAIEQCIGNVWMTAFICGNHQDEAILHQLINRHVNQVHLRPRVVVTDFNAKLYDYNKYRPDYTEYSTVYEMLNIKDKVVANTLFDVRRIESILLLPNINVGEEVIQRNSNQNCSEAFLPNGDRLLGYILIFFILSFLIFIIDKFTKITRSANL
jgi:chromosome segregation ATPase